MQKALTILLAAFVLIGGYYFLIFKPNHTAVMPVVPASATPTAAAVTTTPAGNVATAAATPSVDENAIIIAAVKKGLVAEHGSDAATMTITVSGVSGGYAKGMASAQGGGGMWFAAKVNGAWTLVWDGNGTISCSVLTPYPNFPKTMIAECYDDAAKNTVTR